MTDINLLPSDQHKKEHDEKRLSEKEKEKTVIDLTDPDQKTEKKQDFKVKNQNPLESSLGFFKEFFDKDETPKKEKKDKADVTHKGEEKKQYEKKAEARFEPKKERTFVPHIKEESLKDVENVSAKVENKPDSKQEVKSEKKVETKEEIVKKIDEHKKQSVKSGILKNGYTKGGKVDTGLGVDLLLGARTSTAVPKTIKVLGYVGVLVVLVVVFGGWYLYLDSQVQNSMENVESFDEKIDVLTDDISELEKQTATISKTRVHLRELGKILEGHAYPSRIFEYLEDKTVSGVYYTVANVFVPDNLIILSATALNYDEAAKQIEIFQNDTENVKLSEFSGLNIKHVEQTEELVDFYGPDATLVIFGGTLYMRDDFFADRIDEEEI